MDNLIKQTRVQYSDAGGNREDRGNLREGRIPPQKTQSFKGERKTQNWFQRRSSGKMNRDSDISDGGEYAMAVAAATLAVKSLDESKVPEKIRKGHKTSFKETKSTDTTYEMPELDESRSPQKTPKGPETSFKTKRIPELDESRIPQKISKGPETSFKRTTSKGTTVMMPELDESRTPRSISEGPETTFRRTKSTGAASSTSSDVPEKMPEEKSSKKTIHPAPSIDKAETFIDKNSNMSRDEKDPRKAVAPSLPIVKVPTITDKKTSGQLTYPPIGPALSNAKTLAHADKKTTTQPAFFPTRNIVHDSRKPRVRDIDADAWERAEMAKIKERSQKLKSTIDFWEEKKKKKAKDRKEKTERKLEQKRAAALKHYQEELQSIVAIAGGARAQAEEKRRNEELKVKEKANKIRTTGTYPTSCFCF